jgi:hypothetical protein
LARAKEQQDQKVIDEATRGLGSLRRGAGRRRSFLLGPTGRERLSESSGARLISRFRSVAGRPADAVNAAVVGA